MLLTVVSFDDSLAQSKRSQQINDLIRLSEQRLTATESAQRIFLYTSRESYLPNTSEQRKVIQGALSQAKDVSDSPEQKARIDLMKDLAGKKMDFIESSIKLNSEGRAKEAEALVATGLGVQLMDDFRREANDVSTAEATDVENARAKVTGLSTFLKGFMAVGTLALAILAFFWIRSVKRRLAPLELCVERAKAIADHRFEGVELPIVHAEDEVGSLTQSFNEMTQSLRKGAHKVESVRKQVQETALSLSDRAIEQSAALTQLSSGIQEISATVQELNLSATQMSEKVSALVEEAASREKAGVRGLKAVEESGTATSKVRDQVASMAEFTIALNEKAARVERIVFFVNELTERSNILSINAALLASTSGSGNEAFGVLAEEMQKLTSRSKDSTLEIHETLHSIRTEIQRVVLATEETTKQVEAGDQAAQQASRSIKVLKDAVDEGNDTCLQIVAAVRQQNQALGQVEQALVAMRESSQLVEEGSLSLKEDASVLAALNLELQNSDLLKAVRS